MLYDNKYVDLRVYDRVKQILYSLPCVQALMKKTDETPAPTSAAAEFTENFDAQSQGDNIITSLVPCINRLKIFLHALYNTKYRIKRFCTCILSWQLH